MITLICDNCKKEVYNPYSKNGWIQIDGSILETTNDANEYGEYIPHYLKNKKWNFCCLECLQMKLTGKSKCHEINILLSCTAPGCNHMFQTSIDHKTGIRIPDNWTIHLGSSKKGNVISMSNHIRFYCPDHSALI